MAPPSRLPDALIRHLIGLLVIATGARYLWSGLGRRPTQLDFGEVDRD